LPLHWNGQWLTTMGRVSGYMLDYGHAASGGSGITNVRTSIERYKTAGDASFIFARLKTEDARLGRHLSYGPLSVKSTRVKAPVLGKARFAYLTTYYLAGAQVFDMLVAVPKIGPVKAARLLTVARINPSKTVGGLAERQRTHLIELLSH
jgi:S13-like H2TH domain